MSKLLLSRELRLSPSNMVYVEIDQPFQTSALEWQCDVRYRDVNGSLLGEQKVFGLDALQSLSNASDAIRAWLKNFFPGAEWNGLPVDLAFPRFIPASIGFDNYRELEKLIDEFLEKKFG